MKLYFYDGPVKSFGKIVSEKWHGETRAISESKARTNLEFQYKKYRGLVPKAKVEFPGKIIFIQEVE